VRVFVFRAPALLAAWTTTFLRQAPVLVAGVELFLSREVLQFQMWLKFDSDPAYKFYQKGTFDKRVRFFLDALGQWTGTISRLPGCKWEELLAGNTRPSWFFTTLDQSASYVVLYDQSRNLRVRLDATAMFLRGCNQPAYGFFKNGYGSEN